MTTTSHPQKRERISVVTGAAGFIGSHLVEALLARGDRVRALVHYNALQHRGHLEEVLQIGQKAGARWFKENRLEIVFGDIQDARCVRNLVRDAHNVFHLAALIGIPYSYAAPQSYVNVNVVGTLNVLEACREEGVERILHTSTSEALGTALQTPQNESHPLQAQSPYSATKIAADKLAESYQLSFGLPITTVRPFNTFGPRQSARAVVPTIIAQAVAPECSEVRLGSLDPIRDLTYVTDTVGAFVAVSEAPVDRVAGKLYHLGVGEGIRIGDLATLVLDLVGNSKPIVTAGERLRPEKSEVLALISDHSRIRKEVGWKPEVPLEEGLNRTIQWIRDHLDHYRPSEYTV